MPNRSFCLAALLLLSGSALAQDKTLTFDNASPVKTVHLLNGTSVTIGTTGNLVAKCVLNGTNCADMGGTVGGGPIPTVSLTPSAFSTAPDGANAYSAGTTFTLTAVVSDASVCWRHVTQGPTASTWSGAITANFNTAVTGITLGTASTSYTYSLDCYNSNGGAHAEFSVSTNAGPGSNPPPQGCPDPNWVPTLVEYGFSQASVPNSWLQLQGSTNFPTSQVSSTSILVPKSTISGLVFLGADRAKYVSVQFTTPTGSASGDLSFNDSQVPQTTTTHLGSYYLTISRCPGDFRYGITNPQESTEYQACKNIRKTSVPGQPSAVEGLRWNLTGVSGDGFTNNTCGLQPGTTYYLNYANINPDDGIVTSEHECPNNVSNCGVQFKSN